MFGTSNLYSEVFLLCLLFGVSFVYMRFLYTEYMRSLESGGGGVNTSPNTLLQYERYPLTSLELSRYHRGLSPQDRADLHHHHHEQPPIPPGTGARAHQPKKNRSVHFGSPTTFGAHTPPSPTSPPDTTTPDTTTIDLDSLSLSHSGHHSDSNTKPYSL